MEKKPVNMKETLKGPVKTNEIKRTYSAYLENPNGSLSPISCHDSIKDVAIELKEYIAEKYPALVDTPWRLISKGSDLYIDFGAFWYFKIPNMSIAEWCMHS